MIAVILMALSALVFFLKLLGVDIGDVDMIALGLLFLAAALALALYGLPERRLR